MSGFLRWGLVLACLLFAPLAVADQWLPAKTRTTESANGQFRVTVVPRPIGGALPYFRDKVDGVEPAGQRTDDAQRSPIARVERRLESGEWEFVWQMPLVNDVAPVDVLLTDDGSRLVTFDNWHSMGYGDDAVAIYDARGYLVRKLSLEQMLPPDYVRHLPRTVSSVRWRGDPRLVEGDQRVEIPVSQAERGREELEPVPLQIRLSDGRVMVPFSRRWLGALARAGRYEAERRSAWQAMRSLRATPLLPPGSNDTLAWRRYLFELRDRIAAEDERMGGMLLAAPGEDRGYHDAEDIADWIAFQGDDDEFDFFGNSLIFASPASDRLAEVIVQALDARDAGTMRGTHLAFVGTAEQGRRVAEAARRAGAKVTLVDTSRPFPPGDPLPEEPHPYWFPWGGLGAAD